MSADGSASQMGTLLIEGGGYTSSGPSRWVLLTHTRKPTLPHLEGTLRNALVDSLGDWIRDECILSSRQLHADPYLAV
jgi:hypothetical protein